MPVRTRTAQLRNCRDIPTLIEALENHAADYDVQQVFFAPSCERLELLCWVLTSIDPSGAAGTYLGRSNNYEQLRDRIYNLLIPLNYFDDYQCTAFVDGTATYLEQRLVWNLLLKTAAWVHRQ